MPSSLLHLSSPKRAQVWCDQTRRLNKSIGFVATMGALHAGHLSLIHRAQNENDVVIVSIFVNPLQFNKLEDLKKYPGNQKNDFSYLEKAGVDAVFTGSAEEFLGDANAKKTEELTDPGIYAKGLEGDHRPGHFEGVREVVKRLFGFVGPCRSYFGEKDFQQVKVITELAETLSDIEIVMCATSRYPSGLARSSRNMRLSPAGKINAEIIFSAMQMAKEAWQQEERTPQKLQAVMLEGLKSHLIELEYAEIRDPLNWSEHQPENPIQQARAFIAGNIEGVRLIDNFSLGG